MMRTSLVHLARAAHRKVVLTMFRLPLESAVEQPHPISAQRNLVVLELQVGHDAPQPAEHRHTALLAEAAAPTDVGDDQPIRMMLHEIAEANAAWRRVFDALGMREQHYYGDAARLNRHLQSVSPLPMPDMTIGELIDRIERFATLDAPGALDESADFGADIVSEQAHRLFLALAPITHRACYPVDTTPIACAIGDPQVCRVLNNLLFLIKNLADTLDGINQAENSP